MAKLKAHGFSNQALSLLQNYLCNRLQRSIINGSFHGWNVVITGVPAVLGHFGTNTPAILEYFMFISECQLCSYANNTLLIRKTSSITSFFRHYIFKKSCILICQQHFGP